MNTTRIRHSWVWSLAVAATAAGTAFGHSTSNAYLTVIAHANEPALKVQWDVALRDLEFVLGIDRNGDGKLTWGELKDRQADVTRYLYSHIAFSATGTACRIEPDSLQVDDHSDGSYAVLFFYVRCGGRMPATLNVDYRLFFDVDPSHRGIVVLRRGDDVSSALLSPDSARIALRL